MIEIKDKTKCCGCTACYSVCPKKCIKMNEDNEGFLYPEVDLEHCINCHACERVCPFHSNRGVTANSTCFSVIQNTNKTIRYESTAGGVFSIIAEKIIFEGGTVFAVGYDEDSNVIHKKATTVSELKNLRGSKYVQSNLLDVFAQVKACLSKEVKTLFVGTPCQVHGLINYVGKNELLYTIDLLCLGVSSPGLFKKYIYYLNDKYKSKVTNVEFRNKYFGYSTPNVRVNFQNGKYIQQTYDSKVHANLFFKGHRNVRPCCYECQFRVIPRVSDFTIGDCIDISEINRKMDDDIGTTRCWIHTDKGKALLKNVQNKIMFVVDENEQNVIGGPIKQIPYPKDRRQFFKDAFCLDYKTFVNNWQPKKAQDSIVCTFRYILKHVPFGNLISKRLRKKQANRYKNNVEKAN